MSNHRYAVSKADFQHVKFYLTGKVQNRVFLIHLNERQSDKAIDEFYKLSKPDAADQWIHKYLTTEQISKLTTAIRQRRKRLKHLNQTCSVTISTHAFKILKKLSKRDSVTYSETIERRLGKLCRVD